MGELRQHLVARGVHEGSVDLSARAGNESETLSAYSIANILQKVREKRMVKF